MVVVVCTTKIVTEMVAASVATPLPLVQGCCRQLCQHNTTTAIARTDLQIFGGISRLNSKLAILWV